MKRRVRLGIILAALSAWPAASAQRGSHTVSGVVMDSIRREPLVGAVVEVRDASTSRLARTDVTGAFRVTGVSAGAYRFVVRRIGYAEWARELQISGADTSVAVLLSPLAQSLDTLRVHSGITAIYGVIGSFPDLRPVASARIQVIGAGEAASTDSAGTFFIPLKKPGRYFVRIRRDGFAEQVLSFDVPPDRAVEISALLEVSDQVRQNDADGLWADFDKRMKWQNSSGVVVPASELERSGGTSLSDAIRGAPSFVRKGLRIGASTCVFLNGRPRPGLPLDNVRIEDVVAVELYGPKADETRSLEDSWPRNAPCGSAVGARMFARAQSIPAGVAQWAVIWTRD